MTRRSQGLSSTTAPSATPLTAQHQTGPGILDRRHPVLTPPAKATIPLRRFIAGVDDGKLSDPHEWKS